ncbi:MAG: P27 family phage terminase small subunit [Atopobiaceae bacterium]|nr:P27 family phage terminase small subunit [Atopobiaceae bacterium]
MEQESAAECPITDFECPDYIEDARDIGRFWDVVGLLRSVSEQMATAMDADQVARYVVAERDYVSYSKELKKALKKGDFEETGRIQRQQNTAFKQVQECSNALGMNVSSRLRLDLRKPEKPAEEDPFDRFER